MKRNIFLVTVLAVMICLTGVAQAEYFDAEVGDLDGDYQPYLDSNFYGALFVQLTADVHLSGSTNARGHARAVVTFDGSELARAEITGENENVSTTDYESNFLEYTDSLYMTCLAEITKIVPEDPIDVDGYVRASCSGQW